MLKEKQMWHNEMCKTAYKEAMKELNYLMELKGCVKGVRLNRCTAYVFETPNYYILQSYSTYVAVLHKDSNTLYDVLRIVYGYTATSCQHISKFGQKYGQGEWGVSNKYVARKIK